MHLHYLSLFVNFAVIFAESCDYVQNIRVKYVRRFISHPKIVYLNECISEVSMPNDDVRTITIECVGGEQIRELEVGFITNMSFLQQVIIKHCNVSKIHPEAFKDLPKMQALIVEDNELTHLSKGLFDNIPDIRLISFKTNLISTIDDEAFANLHSLRTIDLSNNKLKQMRRNWFTNTTNIRWVFFQNNSFQDVPEKMFKGWTKANWFDLSFNEISTIHKEAFSEGALRIDFLNLHANCMKQLPLDGLPKVFTRELIISANLLNYLPRKFLYNIEARSVNIIGNPFKCACLREIYDLLTGAQIWVSCTETCNTKCDKATIPVCANPSHSPNQCVESVDEEVTNRTVEYMKSLGYNGLRDWVKQCMSVV